MKLLDHAIGRGVIDHAAAEYRDHQLVGVTLADIHIRGAKERFMAACPGQENRCLGTEPERGDVAQLSVRSTQQGDRIAQELGRVPNYRPATRETRQWSR